MKTDIKIPSLENKFFDLRDKLPGDAYNWSWKRSLSDVKYIAIHHTATDSDQTPYDIANFHIQKNDWGGIGYHFLVDQDGNVFYVGDLQTARANVAGLNEAVIGVALIGNFTQGEVPTSNQLDSARLLCEFFIRSYPDIPNINGWEAVSGHKELPGQKTICPGDSWYVWKKKLFKPKSGETTSNHSNDFLKSQIDNLQTNLALLEQKRIGLQEALAEREKEILKLQSKPKKVDNTLTIVGAFINLYKLILPRKVETFA